MKNLIYPVILAGGSGTRLWPLSREKSPKQFIPLTDGKSLFQETCLRFSNKKIFRDLTIVTHEDHRFLVLNQLQEMGITSANILTEPEAKNTLAACLLASHFLKNSFGEVPLLFTPADHSIENEENLFTSLENASSFVTDGAICIFGIKPTSAHTGYGYIQGNKKYNEAIFGDITFIEKPNQEKAEELIRNGALWNSGIYFCTTKTLEEEATVYAEKTNTIISDFFKDSIHKKNEFFMIPESLYRELESISIDKTITEKTNKCILAPIDIQWNDLGSWSSLYNHFEKDESGNVVRGDSVVIETKNSYIESNKSLVTVFGLENIGVIETPDAVMVFPLHEGESVKKIVKHLTENKREELLTHTTVERPWGKYTILGDDTHFKAKKIIVTPGAKLSLQKHQKRAEHWIVIQGTATVTKDAEIFELKKNESTFLPMGVMHSLENRHEEILSLVEIQTGDYFGEDDIERFEDVYGRK